MNIYFIPWWRWWPLWWLVDEGGNDDNTNDLFDSVFLISILTFSSSCLINAQIPINKRPETTQRYKEYSIATKRLTFKDCIKNVIIDGPIPLPNELITVKNETDIQ